MYVHKIMFHKTSDNLTDHEQIVQDDPFVPQIMEARLEDLAVLETLDSGKGITWARGDITESISAYRYYAGLAFSSTDRQVLEGCDATGISFTRQEPLGVVAQIVPWVSLTSFQYIQQSGIEKLRMTRI